MGFLCRRKHLSPSIQVNMSSININIYEALCSDPEHGEIYRSLFNGGSWFAADQSFWTIQQQKTMKALGDLVETKPSSYNVGKAEALLAQMKEASSQIVPPENSMAVFSYTEGVVKTWSAPAVKKSVTAKTGNAFSVLGDDE